MNLSERQAVAKELGLKFFHHDGPCAQGHVAPRYTNSRQCVDCAKANSAKHKESSVIRQRKARQADPEAYRAKRRAYRQANRDRVNAREQRYRKANPEKILGYRRAYRAANLQQERERTRDHYRRNRSRYMANVRKRTAAKLQRTPLWLTPTDHDAIADIYQQAESRRRFGEDVHVDHILPLQGETVSGLHVVENLQVIPAIDNLRKGNRLQS